jgi:hypothetical protein
MMLARALRANAPRRAAGQQLRRMSAAAAEAAEPAKKPFPLFNFQDPVVLSFWAVLSGTYLMCARWVREDTKLAKKVAAHKAAMAPSELVRSSIPPAVSMLPCSSVLHLRAHGATIDPSLLSLVNPISSLYAQAAEEAAAAAPSAVTAAVVTPAAAPAALPASGSTSPMDWKVADVQSWLTAIELPQHAGVLSHLHGGGELAPASVRVHGGFVSWSLGSIPLDISPNASLPWPDARGHSSLNARPSPRRCFQDARD